MLHLFIKTIVIKDMHMRIGATIVWVFEYSPHMFKEINVCNLLHLSVDHFCCCNDVVLVFVFTFINTQIHDVNYILD